VQLDTVESEQRGGKVGSTRPEHRQTLSIGGDPLERAYASFLNERLPSYERIWSHFIGNDGQSEMPTVPGLSDELDRMRQKVNQFSYSAMESALGASRCRDQVEAIVSRTASEEALSAHDFLDLSTQLLAFYAHLGRIHDLVEKLGFSIRLPDLARPLKEYYQQRNNVVHEARLPMIFLDGSIGVVPPEGLADDSQRWRKNQMWTSKWDSIHAELVSLISDTFEGVLRNLESAFATAFSSLMSSPLVAVANLLELPAKPLNIATAPSGTLKL
jgi:hypothetical protein